MSHPIKIAITVDGGIVTAVSSSSPNIEVDIIDLDDDCDDADDPFEQHRREITKKIDDGEYPYELLEADGNCREPGRRGPLLRSEGEAS